MVLGITSIVYSISYRVWNRFASQFTTSTSPHYYDYMTHTHTLTIIHYYTIGKIVKLFHDHQPRLTIRAPCNNESKRTRSLRYVCTFPEFFYGLNASFLTCFLQYWGDEPLEINMGVGNFNKYIRYIIIYFFNDFKSTNST